MEFKCFKTYRALIKWIVFMKSDYQCFDANNKIQGIFSGVIEGYVQTKNDVFQGQWYNTILLIYTEKDLGRHVVRYLNNTQ